MPAYLGQHFLIDQGVARRAVEALELSPDDVVVEIGPGRGILTRQLYGKCDLTSVELDQDLIADLRREFPENDRFRLLHADFLKLSSPRIAGRGEGEGIKFVGNLPYAVASPILQKVLAWENTALAVFMFQKEVCDRLTAGPGSRDYGVLSIVAALHAEVSWVAEAGRDKFRPRPRVDSGVLKFQMSKAALPRGVTEQRLLTVVKAAFSQRRKRLANPLAHGLGLPKDQVLKALAACAIPPDARAEQVPVAGFAALTCELLPAKRKVSP